MRSFRNSASGARRARALRPVLVTTLALLAVGCVVPSAYAWHAHLVVKKVNLGGPPSDVFQFQIEKSPNLYEDIWEGGSKQFELQGAPRLTGSWYRSYGPGPYPAGANMQVFGDLWAGYDHGFEDWVTYKVTELSSSESPLSDYTTTASCEIGIQNGNGQVVTDETWVTENAITAQYGQWSYAKGVTDGKTHVATSVRWNNATRYVTTCTFVNRYRARVRVRKTFTDTITAQPSISAEINGVVRNRANAEGVPVDPADSTLEHEQNTEWVKVPVGPDGPLAPVTVGELDGDPGDPALSLYDTTIACGAGITTTLDAQTGRWTLAGIAPGQDVTCTIHNARKPVPPTTPPKIPPTTGPPSTGTTQSGVAGSDTSGVTRPRAAARLTGTVGCATARYASASISGSQVRRVTFYVNGRKVKTLTGANAGTSYRLRYRTAGLRNGSYAVRARVEFSKASGAKPRTFGLQFSRCSRRAVQPTFTG